LGRGKGHMRRVWLAFLLLGTGLLVSLFPGAVPGWTAEPDIGEHIYPLPLTEIQHVIIDWLRNSAFRIDRETKTDEGVRLFAETAQDQWQILLERHSPLATRVQVKVVGQDTAANPAIQAFWQHIDDYLHETADSALDTAPSIPASVRSRRNTVVCIHATSENGSDLKVTGFGVDARGLIVSTRHDLAIDKPVQVWFADGSVAEGRVIKADPVRDLVLVQIRSRLIAAVSLQQGRNRLRPGERLFSIACLSGTHARIDAGYLNNPPRRVAGEALWQAKIHVVHGSSGSPVFDTQGRLVGVVRGRLRGTDSIGFLIPFETLLQFLE
jgi:serine protease Do